MNDKICKLTRQTVFLCRCLVLEDSVTGLTAALAAGMRVVAVANPFSKPLLQKQTLLPQGAIVYYPEHLDKIVEQQCRELHLQRPSLAPS